MKELFDVWGHTRQIVIIALTAAIYAGMLIPFKAIPIVPGLTELRPANVIPVLFGILFGPAAAWGSAIGNLIADFFGTLSPASAFGFVGNFFFSYTACKLWHIFIKDAVTMNFRQTGIFILISIAASLVCALVVGFGVQILGMAPFKVLFPIIFINNSLMSSILGIILIKLLYKRIERTGLLYTPHRAPVFHDYDR
jgi:energy-coupling factor transport system substrate-specific component